jgi:hypothetical protein
MPPVGFELTISVLEREKTVRALERAATAIGNGLSEIQKRLFSSWALTVSGGATCMK